MSLYDFVYNLQRKPDKTKKMILAVLLGVSFVALVAAWVFMFKNRLAETGRVSSPAESSLLGESKELTSPVSALIEGFKGFKSDLADIVGSYNSSLRREEKKTRPIHELPME